MSIFKHDKTSNETGANSALADIALKSIHDGVIITDKNNVIQFINPAAVLMTGSSSADSSIGLDYGLIIKLESKEGRELSDKENPLIQAMTTNQALEPVQLALIDNSSDKRTPVSISVHLAEGMSGNKIITFRNITKELEEEGEQTEFISTASHEMRTPVATIDGYLSLALNPQTATIDERARGYLTAAEKASKHLGKLFQDLLDVTKLDDGRIKPNFEPVEMVDFVQSIADGYKVRAEEAKLTFEFGSEQSSTPSVGRKMQQVVYSFVDISFMQEILDNLIENALKYTPAGGSIYINVRGDGDRVLINVTDSGIGISAEDLSHIFQKFYRVDNSDTREIGGTGLGLYLVKQRTEAMGGKVWAESAFGEGSTFYISLPRLTADEYEKRMIVVNNNKMQEQMAKENATSSTQGENPFKIASTPNIQTMSTPQPAAPLPKLQPAPAQPVPTAQPVAAQPASTQPATVQPAPAQPTPTMQPVSTPQPVAAQSAPTSQPIAQPTAQPIAQPATQSIVQPAASSATITNPPTAPPGAPVPSPAQPTSPTPQVQNQINNNLNGENK